jgi:hypothetical protein
MRRIAHAALVLAIALQFGWILLNARSSPWVPVPPSMARIEDGTVYVNAGWLSGGFVVYMPFITAGLCIVALATMKPRTPDK